MSREPFPLDWPVGKPRTKSPCQSRFSSKRSVASAYDELLAELSRFSALQVRISTNIRITHDGRPRSGQAEPADRGVAIYFARFTTRGGQREKLNYCMALDKYDRVVDNLHALSMVISSYRVIERHGGGELLEQATAGFLAISESSESTLDRAAKLRAIADDPSANPNEAANARRALEGLQK